jgi:hypothetical protein
MLKVSAVAKDPLVSLPFYLVRPNIEVNGAAGPPNDRAYALSIYLLRATCISSRILIVNTILSNRSQIGVFGDERIPLDKGPVL